MPQILKTSFLIIILITLSACAAFSPQKRFNDIENRLLEWHGYGESIIFKYWGAPDNKIAMDSGGYTYTYKMKNNTSSVKKVGSYGSSKNPTVYVPTQVELNCKISFSVDSKKMVVNHLVDGQLGACEALMKSNPFAAARHANQVTAQELRPLDNITPTPSGKWEITGWTCLDGDANNAGISVNKAMTRQVKSGQLSYVIDLDNKTATIKTLGCEQNLGLTIDVINNRYKMTAKGGTSKGCPVQTGLWRVLERRHNKLYDYNSGSANVCSTGFSVQEFDLIL